MKITNEAVAAAVRRLRRRTLRDLRKTKEGTKSLSTGLARISKKFGAAALSIVSEINNTSVESVDLGLQDLNDIINGTTETVEGKLVTHPGTGRGLPRGRVIEIFGPESSGKTTLTLEMIAAYQSHGLVCAFIDAEHALDVDYAQKLEVDMDALLLSQPDSGEQALQIADQLVDTGVVDLIVIDSVAALVPQAELDGEIGDAHIGLQARLMSQALRKMTAKLGRGSKTTVIFINQVRHKIGGFSRFGPVETTPGGNALKFYAALRFRVNIVQQLKESNRVVGVRSKVKIIKNKVGQPFREVFVDITRGRGITATSRANVRDGAADDDDE